VGIEIGFFGIKRRFLKEFFIFEQRRPLKYEKSTTLTGIYFGS
jgi:hypothetical protein